MTQIGISGSGAAETLLNIFPNPCVNDTYLYTDDPEAAGVYIYDLQGNMLESWPILPGRTMHVQFRLAPGTYQILLKDHFSNILGNAKPFFVSELH